MDKFRSRPKGDYIENTKWQELYVLAEHWKSDLLFYRDDLKFLHHLIEKYFIWIVKRDDLEKVRTVGSALLKDDRECAELLDKVDKHMAHIADFMEYHIKNGGQDFRKEHEKLEDDIALFVKKVRENRKQVFSVTEHLMDSEKLEYLLKD